MTYSTATIGTHRTPPNLPAGAEEQPKAEPALRALVHPRFSLERIAKAQGQRSGAEASARACLQRQFCTRGPLNDVNELLRPANPGTTAPTARPLPTVPHARGSFQALDDLLCGKGPPLAAPKQTPMRAAAQDFLRDCGDQRLRASGAEADALMYLLQPARQKAEIEALQGRLKVEQGKLSELQSRVRKDEKALAKAPSDPKLDAQLRTRKISLAASEKSVADLQKTLTKFESTPLSLLAAERAVKMRHSSDLGRAFALAAQAMPLEFSGETHWREPMKAALKKIHESRPPQEQSVLLCNQLAEMSIAQTTQMGVIGLGDEVEKAIASGDPEKLKGSCKGFMLGASASLAKLQVAIDRLEAASKLNVDDYATLGHEVDPAELSRINAQVRAYSAQLKFLSETLQQTNGPVQAMMRLATLVTAESTTDADRQELIDHLKAPRQTLEGAAPLPLQIAPQAPNYTPELPPNYDPSPPPDYIPRPPPGT